MATSEKIEQRRPDLSNIKGQAARAQLRPPLPGRPSERRNLSSRRALVRRIHGEFLEMPGLTLSIQQAARLFSLPTSVCTSVFGELVGGNCLRVTIDGRYALLRKSCEGAIEHAERNHASTKSNDSQESDARAEPAAVSTRRNLQTGF